MRESYFPAPTFFGTTLALRAKRMMVEGPIWLFSLAFGRTPVFGSS